MKQSKHTPEWTKLNRGQIQVGTSYIMSIYKTDGELIPQGDFDKIAAAPDMKEAGADLHAALYDLRKSYEHVQKHFGYKVEQSMIMNSADAALKKWVAAIAKATGGK